MDWKAGVAAAFSFETNDLESAAKHGAVKGGLAGLLALGSSALAPVALGAAAALTVASAVVGILAVSQVAIAAVNAAGEGRFRRRDDKRDAEEMARIETPSGMAIRPKAFVGKAAKIMVEAGELSAALGRKDPKAFALVASRMAREGQAGGMTELKREAGKLWIGYELALATAVQTAECGPLDGLGIKWLRDTAVPWWMNVENDLNERLGAPKRCSRPGF